jgi:hypothetical protein
MIQGPLIQDAAAPGSARLLRVVTIDIATGATHEYGYPMTVGSGVSEVVAINSHAFLADERNSKGEGDGPPATQLFRFDIAGARDITGLKGAEAAASTVKKSATPFIDLAAVVAAHGGPIAGKIEGLAFGPDVKYRGRTYHTLFASSDNDFDAEANGANPLYVFGFQDADLPGYVAQSLK